MYLDFESRLIEVQFCIYTNIQYTVLKHVCDCLFYTQGCQIFRALFLQYTYDAFHTFVSACGFCGVKCFV